MDDKMLERRMELLNKNYERMPNKTDVSAVIKAIEKEQKPKKEKRPLLHWPYAASFIGVLLIASVLVLQATNDGGEIENSGQSEMSSAEVSKTVSEIESYYEIRKMQAIGSLGLSEEIFNQSQMAIEAEAYLVHIKGWAERADMQSQFLSEPTGSMKETFDNMLMTPQQMVNGIKGKELTDAESETWVASFSKTQGNLLSLYETEIAEYQEEWKEEIKYGQLEGRDILLEREKEYSEDLLALVNGATANGISLTYSENGDRMEAFPDVGYLTVLLSASELPEVYMDVLRLKSYPRSVQAGVLAVTRARAGGDLLLYERTLKNLPSDSSFRHELQLKYSTLFRIYVKGAAAQPIFNEDGKLKKEVKENFEKLMELHPDSVTAERVQPYYNKLKDNDFFKTDDWDEFYIEF